MPIQLQPGAVVDCGLGEVSSSSSWLGESRAGVTGAAQWALEQCLAAVRSATNR